jgi:hypothetical protein
VRSASFHSSFTYSTGIDKSLAAGGLAKQRKDKARMSLLVFIR